MGINNKSTVVQEDVRDDWVPKEAYLDPNFAALEQKNMWSRVWQIACREEELPKSGNFVTVDVGTESFLIVRSTDNVINAFHNVCQHRGRRLVDAPSGRSPKFVCGFHAWTYDTNGNCTRVVDQEDWGDRLPACKSALKKLRVDTWGGFVFVNMDLECEPLEKYLGYAGEILSNYEFDKMRLRSKRTARLPVNWKIAVEAFNEGYHVQGTHPQALQIMDDPTSSYAFGPHAMFFQPEYGSRGLGQPSARTKLALNDDYRPGIVRYVEYFERDLKGLFCDRHPAATERLLTEVDPSADYLEIMAKMVDFWKDAAIEAGAGWPENLTPEISAKAGIDWHLFPNAITLMTPDAAIWYRIRPDGDKVDSCFFDIWCIQRYAEGTEPVVTEEYYDPWRSNADWGEIFSQDFANAEKVQSGMRSSGFEGARTNPKQEVAVSNFHTYLHRYVRGEHP